MRERIFQVFILCLVALIIVGGLFMVYPRWVQRQALRERRAAVQEQIEEKRKAIAKLTENQRRFRTDPEFVEAIARVNRRVFPGELVFVFDD